ncbi:AMP-dependent synthetase/ligase [Patescibacteria group bacterium]|nr:AMP-dependent synthetase/ligase [Patescibacteria group bacterium]MBU4512735.1 AMP-dependent synthetase/ligase [Patescibacteria group bacterium]MCG2693075.1 AMP-dependent synthetase/ligase [Candidatus Parcubacteria bacterium]
MLNDYMITIPSQFFQTVSQHPNKDFLVAKKDGQWQGITYTQSSQFVRFFAQGLLELGLAKGERIAILSKNRPAWAIVDLAAMSADGISVPIHTTLSAAKIQYILEDSGAKVLFVAGEENIDKILTIRSRLKMLETIICLDGKFKEPGMMLFDEVIELGKICQKKLNWENGNPQEIASIVYTSGTTGEPKGVMLSHQNFLSNVEAATKAVPIIKEDSFLSFLPLSHVLERMAGYYTPMSKGATIYYAESVKKLSDNLREVKPTVLVCVPRIFERVYEKILDKVKQGKALKKKLFFAALKAQSELHHARREGRSLGTLAKLKANLLDKLVCKKVRAGLGGHLRFAISGGASLSKQIARFFEDLGIRIVEGYGLTETAPVVTVNRLEKYEFGTVGLPLEAVEVKISPDKEIMVKGGNVMPGYWKKPQETHQVLAADGWFATGDLGFLDEQGFLTIIGRKKEMIITAGGKNVAPEPVENALQLSKYINQAMIIGNQRKFISSLIVPDFEKLKEFAKERQISYREIRELLANDAVKHLFEQEIERQLREFSDFEKVKKFALIAQEFSQEAEELTPTLKLRRAVIGSKYKKEVEAMYKEGYGL